MLYRVFLSMSTNKYRARPSYLLMCATINTCITDTCFQVGTVFIQYVYCTVCIVVTLHEKATNLTDESVESLQFFSMKTSRRQKCSSDFVSSRSQDSWLYSYWSGQTFTLFKQLFFCSFGNPTSLGQGEPVKYLVIGGKSTGGLYATEVEVFDPERPDSTCDEIAVGN